MFADVPRNGGMRVYKHLFLFLYEVILISNFVSQAKMGLEKLYASELGLHNKTSGVRTSLRDTIR